ncbi:MAG TPA: DUF3313 domain-containing protein [Stellaceae bacterium]
MRDLSCQFYERDPNIELEIDMTKTSAAIRYGFLFLAALVAAALGACAPDKTADPTQQTPIPGLQAGQIVGGGTKEITEGVEPTKGFLPHPELLQPGGPGQPALVYLKPQAGPMPYRKVLLSPVSIWAGPNSGLRDVPPKQQAELANIFYADLYDALKGKCQLVKDAAPDTIQLNIALVDTEEPNPVLNTVASYAPYASTAYALSSLVFNKGVGYFAGTATVAAYAIDPTNGTLLWEVVDKRGGTTALVADTLDNWRDVRHAFEAWSAQARTRLQELGICQK